MRLKYKNYSVTNAKRSIRTRIVGGQWRHKITILWKLIVSLFPCIWQIRDVTNRQLFACGYYSVTNAKRSMSSHICQEINGRMSSLKYVKSESRRQNAEIRYWSYILIRKMQHDVVQHLNQIWLNLVP